MDELKNNRVEMHFKNNISNKILIIKIEDNVILYIFLNFILLSF